MTSQDEVGLQQALGEKAAAAVPPEPLVPQAWEAFTAYRAEPGRSGKEIDPPPRRRLLEVEGKGGLHRLLAGAAHAVRAVGVDTVQARDFSAAGAEGGEGAEGGAAEGEGEGAQQAQPMVGVA
jgi:hypothetical protein